MRMAKTTTKTPPKPGNPEEKKEALQEKYMEFKLITEQLKELKNQIELLDEQLTDTIYVSQSLDELQGVEKNTEILVPITSGIFIKARVKNTNSVIVNVGASVCVQKTIPDAQKLLQEKVDSIQEVREQLIARFEAHKTEAQAAKKQLKALSAQVEALEES